MPTFTHYNGELLAHRTDAIAKGRLEAAAHRPPSDSSRMDQHEASVQSEAEQWMASERHLFDSVLTDASRSAVELQQKVHELQGRIEQLLADDALDSAVKADMAEDRQPLIEATEARMRAQVDCRHFRIQNGITEEAVYPESKIWHFGIIAILALIETSVNTVFYENAQGLLGGFIVALAVSAINMLSALALGNFFRFKNLSATNKKALGWLSFIAFVTLSIYCNALFAAFRAEYQLLADPTDAMQVRTAFTKATEEASKIFLLRMHFGDLMSFILFFIGLLLSGFAFYKGYTLDDRFPGHGPKDRLVKAAQKREQELEERLRQKVKDFLHTRRHQLQAVVHEPAQIANSVAIRSASLQQAASVYKTQQDAVQRDFSVILSAYRGANAAVRATEPPQYFRHIPDLLLPINDAVLQNAFASLTNVQQQARDLGDKYQAALNAKLNELQRNAAAILNEKFAAFLSSVESEAETVINRQTVSIRTPSATVANAV